MKLFWILNGQKLKRRMILVVAAFFTAAIIYMDRDAIPMVFPTLGDQSEQPQAIYNVPTDEKRLALTFDISWGNERPPAILDVLEQKGLAKATFFLSAPWADNYPQVVKRIQELGFEIGSHGYKHTNYTKLKDQEIREQITKAGQMLHAVTGEKPRLLRTPNGDFDKRVLRIAQELGYTVIQWDTNSHDWTNPGMETIVENVLSKAHPGDIILLHASDSAQQTPEALALIIDNLRQQGYQFVSVSELITGVDANVQELN